MHRDEDVRVIIDYRIGDLGTPKLLAWCRLCGSVLTAMCEALGVEVHLVLDGNGDLDRQLARPKRRRPAPLPSPADLLAWKCRLAFDVEAKCYLQERRGLTFTTVRRFGIGHDGERYTLPVSDGGLLVNLRRYSPTAVKDKMLGLAGRTSKNLYPSLPQGRWVLLCEGEWDALVARQHGLPAVTSTGGVDGWDDRWTERLRGREVAIVFDSDPAGRGASVRRAEPSRRPRRR